MRWIPVLVAACMLAGCGQTEAQNLDRDAEVSARVAVSERLRDPNSAQFGDISVRQAGGRRYACGSVNAKNGFGGYAGEQRFIWKNDVVMLEGEASSLFAKAWSTFCV